MSYSIYLTVSLALTVWVARTLERDGRVFLVDVFQRKPELADSAQRLPLFGFYLVNAGFVTLMPTTSQTFATMRAALELVLEKLGGVLLVLGITHFPILFFVRRPRGRGLERAGQAHAHGGGGWSPESAPLGKVLE